MSRRAQCVAVAGITLVGGLLRAFQLGSQSLWLDELFSVAVARLDLVQMISQTSQGDIVPPFFYLLLHLALKFGSDEIAARSISLIFGVAVIPLFFLLAGELFDLRVAVLATLGLAVNPFHLFYAQEARMYTQLAFFSVGALLFFQRAWRSGRSADWILFGLTTTLALYTHYLAILSLLAVDVFAIFQWRSFRRGWRWLLADHGLIALLFAPWSAVFLQQFLRVQTGFWRTIPSPLTLFSTLYLFLLGNFVPLLLVPLALFASLALVAFTLLGAARAVARNDSWSTAVALTLCVFGVPITTLFLVSLVRPLYVEHTLIASSLGLYLLLAWAVAQVPPRRTNLALGGLITVVTLIALFNYYTNPDVQKPPMRQAARALATQYQTGEAVTHTSDSSALAFMYYAPRLPNTFLAGDPDYAVETTRGRAGRIAGLDPKTVGAVVAEHPRVWLVVALDHNVEYQRVRIREFDMSFSRIAQVDEGGIALLLYEVK